MSRNEDNNRERKGPGLLDGILLASVAGAALYFSYQKNQEGREMADALLDVHDRETSEKFKQQMAGKEESEFAMDPKLRTIPKALKKKACAVVAQKLASDPMWNAILQENVQAQLEWIVAENMDSLDKKDKKAGVTSIAWKSGYQCILTRRFRETTTEGEADPLDVVATFALVHGAEIDPIFQRKDTITGLSAEQNDRLEAVGKFLNDIKLKHFFNRKQPCVEVTRFVVTSYLQEKGVEDVVFNDLVAKTKLPILITTSREDEKKSLQKLGFELLEEAQFPGTPKSPNATFRTWFLVKYP